MSTPSSPKDEISIFLSHFNLSKYETALRDAGLDDLTLLYDLDAQDIENIAKEAKLQTLTKKKWARAVNSVQTGKYAVNQPNNQGDEKNQSSNQSSNQLSNQSSNQASKQNSRKAYVPPHKRNQSSNQTSSQSTNHSSNQSSTGSYSNTFNQQTNYSNTYEPAFRSSNHQQYSNQNYNYNNNNNNYTKYNNHRPRYNKRNNYNRYNNNNQNNYNNHNQYKHNQSSYNSYNTYNQPQSSYNSYNSYKSSFKNRNNHSNHSHHQQPQPQPQSQSKSQAQPQSIQTIQSPNINNPSPKTFIPASASASASPTTQIHKTINSVSPSSPSSSPLHSQTNISNKSSPIAPSLHTDDDNNNNNDKTPNNDDHKNDNDDDNEQELSPQQIYYKTKLEEYVSEYKQKHQKKYIPPFQIRKLRKEFDILYKEEKRKKRKEKEDKAAKEKAAKAKKDNDNDDVSSDKDVDKDGDKDTIDQPLDETKFPSELIYFRNFYISQSKYYVLWQQSRRDGWNNKHTEKFFDLKHKNQDNHSRSSDKNIVSLFRRFYRYAIDIDNVCGYSNDLLRILSDNNGDIVYFMDIGFAPGGMSRLLLDCNKSISGLGVTLPPYECGNAFITELLNSSRFLVREYDIVELCRKIHTKMDAFSLLNIYNNNNNNGNNNNNNNMYYSPAIWNSFHGFDLIIIGITCHQDFNNNERLDHQILLSELYIAFLTLNNGGSILIRHKIALDCIHQHILYIFLKCFQSYSVGKPMTEFSIRKTFWITWKGFNKNACKELNLISSLRKLIHEYNGKCPPYGRNPKTNQYWNPSIIDKTPEEIIADVSSGFLSVMDPVFKIQMDSLKSFCTGKKDRLCSKREYCNRKDCNRGHNADDCIDGFYDAMIAVDNVQNQQIILHKYHSKILMNLEKNIKRNHKYYFKNKYNQYHNHYNDDFSHQINDVRNLQNKHVQNQQNQQNNLPIHSNKQTKNDNNNNNDLNNVSWRK